MPVVRWREIVRQADQQFCEIRHFNMAIEKVAQFLLPTACVTIQYIRQRHKDKNSARIQ